MTKHILLYLIFLILCSCKKEDKSAKQNIVKPDFNTSKIPDSLSKNSVFIEKTQDGIFRIWVQSRKSLGKYFYSDTLNILKAEQYTFQNNHFIKTKSTDLAETAWSYFSIDSTNIASKKLNKKKYFLISANTTNMGNAIPDQEVQFWAINKNDINENYELGYSGYPSNLCDECVKGSYVENQKIKNNKSIKNLLHEFSKKSKLIYQPSQSEKNPNNYKNYKEKWEKDNGQHAHFGAGNIGELDIINSTYYKENLFTLSGEADSTIENAHYMVSSYFRGAILVYDKNKKLYFPLIVESCSYSCNKNIEFVNEYTLKITYEDNSSYEADLTKIIFDT